MPSLAPHSFRLSRVHFVASAARTYFRRLRKPLQHPPLPCKSWQPSMKLMVGGMNSWQARREGGVFGERAGDEIVFRNLGISCTWIHDDVS